MSKQLVKPFYGSDTWAGGCLPAAQDVFGAPGGPVSATASANATKFRHTGPLPKDTTAILWLDHYGTYTNYLTGDSYWDNWGHVLVWDPTAFGGKGGFYSSRRSGYGPGEWFRTLAEAESAFNATYRGFWSEDINGVRTIEYVAPAPSKPTTPTNPQPLEGEDEDMKYIGHYIGTQAPSDPTKNSCVIYQPASGFYTTWSGVGQNYTNQMAAQFQTGAFNRITAKHWAQIKASLDKIASN